MDVNEILKRIEFKGNISEKDLELLEKLCVCFMSSVPFENLDLFGGKKKTVDLERLYRDIVIKRRGGICCELNGLFHWLLVQIGFDVQMLKAYTADKNTFDDVGDHMTLVVTLKDGGKYLTDVGWGASSFTYPLSMTDLGKEQNVPNGNYRVISSDGYYVLEKKKRTGTDLKNVFGAVEVDSSSEWYPLYRFKLINERLENFGEKLDYAAALPGFTTKFKVVLMNSTGKKFIHGKKFVRKEYVKPNSTKVLDEKEILPEDLFQLLKDEFGLYVDFDLDLRGLC